MNKEAYEKISKINRMKYSHIKASNMWTNQAIKDIESPKLSIDSQIESVDKPIIMHNFSKSMISKNEIINFTKGLSKRSSGLESNIHKNVKLIGPNNKDYKNRTRAPNIEINKDLFFNNDWMSTRIKALMKLWKDSHATTKNNKTKISNLCIMPKDHLIHHWQMKDKNRNKIVVRPKSITIKDFSSTIYNRILDGQINESSKNGHRNRSMQGTYKKQKTISSNGGFRPQSSYYRSTFNKLSLPVSVEQRKTLTKQQKRERKFWQSINNEKQHHTSMNYRVEKDQFHPHNNRFSSLNSSLKKKKVNNTTAQSPNETLDSCTVVNFELKPFIQGRNYFSIKYFRFTT